MPDHSDQDQLLEDDPDEEEMQEIQQRRLALLSSATAIFTACQAVIDLLTPVINGTPYHTSVLSGEEWVQELLSGHPRWICTELGVYQQTFLTLVL